MRSPPFISYSKMLIYFYDKYFRMLMSTVHLKLGVCKQEIEELNRRFVYKAMKLNPIAEMKV